jgi:hypothetical protein
MQFESKLMILCTNIDLTSNSKKFGQYNETLREK